MMVGIVGKSGAGKSAAGRFFERNGFLHIDGDKVARAVVEKGSPALDDLTCAFGEKILQPDGNLNRKVLGDLVFSDPEKLALLNEITHPYILCEFEQEIADAGKPALIDAAALIESGFTGKCDAVIFLRSSRQNRLKRVLARDGLDKESALRRIDAQREDAFYESHADYIIDNDGTPEELEGKLSVVLKELMAGANEKIT